MNIKVDKEEKRVQISLDFYEATDMVCLYLPVMIADQKKIIQEAEQAGKTMFLPRDKEGLKWLEVLREKLDQAKEEI